MKKYLLAGIVLGTTAYAFCTSLKLSMYKELYSEYDLLVDDILRGLQLLNDAEEEMNKRYEHE